MTKKQTDKEEAIARLREWLKPGDTVYTILRSVSRSGMSREIGVVINRDGAFLHPNYAVADALGWRINKHGDGIKVSGCGMDMGFHVVYNLGYVMYPNGVPCTGDANTCRSNDHNNNRSLPYDTAITHSDGGYAFRHAWL